MTRFFKSLQLRGCSSSHEILFVTTAHQMLDHCITLYVYLFLYAFFCMPRVTYFRALFYMQWIRDQMPQM